MVSFEMYCKLLRNVIFEAMVQHEIKCDSIAVGVDDDYHPNSVIVYLMMPDNDDVMEYPFPMKMVREMNADEFAAMFAHGLMGM